MTKPKRIVKRYHVQFDVEVLAPRKVNTPEDVAGGVAWGLQEYVGDPENLVVTTDSSWPNPNPRIGDWR